MSYQIGDKDDRKSLCESRRFDAFGKPTDTGEFVLILATYLESAFDALEQAQEQLDRFESLADKKLDQAQARIEQLESALVDAKDHLDYCGYGDSWERECAVAQKLEEKIDAALLAIRDSGS